MCSTVCIKKQRVNLFAIHLIHSVLCCFVFNKISYLLRYFNTFCAIFAAHVPMRTHTNSRTLTHSGYGSSLCINQFKQYAQRIALRETRTHTFEMIRYYLLSVRHFSIIAVGMLHYQHVFHIIKIIIVRAITTHTETKRHTRTHTMRNTASISSAFEQLVINK